MYDVLMNKNDNKIVSIRPRPSFVGCFLAYVRISFFKASPEQLPTSKACTIKAFLVYCAVNLWLLDIHSSALDVLVKIAVEMGLLTVFLKIGLMLTKKPERFEQTLSALIGIGMVISLISVPIYYLFIPQFLQQQDISQTVINITLVLLVWNLAVISHIFKRSFEISTLMAAVVAFNYLIFFEMIVISLLPEST
jgi:hypothetical protein